MAEYRFRTGDGGELVLQVAVYPERRPYEYCEREVKWRDATIADVPVFDPFNPPRDAYSCRGAEANKELQDAQEELRRIKGEV